MKTNRKILSVLFTLAMLIPTLGAIAPVSFAEGTDIVLNQEFLPVADGCWDTYSESDWKYDTATLYTTQQSKTAEPARSAYLKFDLADIRANLAKGAVLTKAEVRLTLQRMNGNYNYYDTDNTAEGPRVSLYGYADDTWGESADTPAERLTVDEALAAIASKNPTDPTLNYVTLPNQATDLTFTLDVKDWLEGVLSDANDGYMSFEIAYREKWAKNGTYVMYSKEYTNEAYRPSLVLSYRDPSEMGLTPSTAFEGYQSFESEADVYCEDGEFTDSQGSNIRTTQAASRASLKRSGYIKFPISGVRDNIAKGAQIKKAYIRLYISGQSYTGTAKVQLYAYDNDNWTDEDVSTLEIRTDGEYDIISKDPRNPLNTYVQLPNGYLKGTPIQIDVTDALIAETKKAGDNYLSAEIGYFSEWLKGGTTAFYSRNYSGGNHPLLEVEYADIGISDACIFKDNLPVATLKDGENVLEYTIDNSYLSDKAVNAIWAIYKTEAGVKKLVDVMCDEVTASASANTTIKNTINIDESGEDYSVSLMLWRNEGTLLPLGKPNNLGTAPLWMPSIFDDNAVIQRDIALPVWGKATVGEEVTVTLDGKQYTTTADRYGEWKVECDPVAVSDETYTLTVESGNDTLEFTGLLAGDVWLCSGQSNMVFLLCNTDDAEEDANLANSYPDIRFFDQAKNGSGENMEDVTDGSWSICSYDTAMDFSAVAYLFGKDLYDELNIPIGLINCSYGGAPMEAFTSYEALDESELWFRKLLKNYKDENRDATHIWNAMIEPIVPYAIKGTLWYQGCANLNRSEEYVRLHHIMLDDWRARWGYDFPFIYTQVAPYSGSSGELREAQREFLHEGENVAMAVIMDVGDEDDIHPTNKRTVADRLARCAKYLVYSLTDTEYKFPEPTAYAIGDDGSVTITFDGVYDGLSTSDGSAPVGFEIISLDADSETIYTDADSVVINADNTITVKCSTVSEPTGVRYGFEAYPNPELNLYNSAGLVATSFTHTFE